MATATTEGDPVLAIGGEVPLDDRYKHTHQSLDAVALMRPVTRFSQSALNAHDLPEVLGNAIRAAEKGRLGAAFLGLPTDVGLAEIDADPAAGWGQQVRQGPSHPEDLKTAADILKDLQRPLLLLGMQASDPCISEALQTYVQRSGIPYCATFQGPGCWVAPEQYLSHTCQGQSSVAVPLGLILTISRHNVCFACHSRFRPSKITGVRPKIAHTASQQGANGLRGVP